MFSEVPIAIERLAFCLRLQRRVGASHALLHLRRLAAACSRMAGSARALASPLENPLAQLDRAFAVDRLDESAMIEAERLLSFVRFRLWQLEHTTVSRVTFSAATSNPADRR
jgi:hypothetical protein